MIRRLEYVGFAVHNVDQTRRMFRDLINLDSRSGAPDPLIGASKTAWIPFPNECSVLAMESSDSNSAVGRYLAERGPGLERVRFLTDDIAEDCERIKRAGISLGANPIVKTDEGDRLIVPGEYVSGVTVELLQPADGSYQFRETVSPTQVLGLQHIGVAVHDLEKAADQFRVLFDLAPRNLRTDQHEGEQKDMMVEPGNDRLWLHVTESWGTNARVREFIDSKGPGLEHLCIEVEDIRSAVTRVTDHDVPLFDHKIFTNRADGFEAFVYPEYSTGVTIELIEPYPTSRGYRPRK